MNTKEFTSDAIKKSLQKYYDLYTKRIQQQLSTLQDQVDTNTADIVIIKGKIDGLSSLEQEELDYIIDNE